MESVLHKNRPHYYRAIENARKANDSGAFIEFTLAAILEIISRQKKHQDEHKEEHQVEHQVEHQEERQVELTETMSAVLKALGNKSLPRKEIFAVIGMSADSRSFKRNIEPLLAGGFVEMTVPGKPNSKLQKYRLTEKGRAALAGASK